MARIGSPKTYLWCQSCRRSFSHADAPAGACPVCAAPVREMSRFAAIARGFMANDGNDGRLGPLLWRSETVRRLGVRALGRFVFRANAETEAELLGRLPAMLDRIDGWIEAGVLNGDELYAADFVIAPCLALMGYRSDVMPEIERRPALDLLDRILPEPGSAESAYPSGHVSQHSHAP